MKKFAVYYIFACLNFLILFAACDKEGYKELKGTWIQELERGEEDGESYVFYMKYRFDEDKVTVTDICEVEGEVMKAVTYQGEWKFIDGKSLDDKKEIGMVEIEYDLSSLRLQDNIGEVEESRERELDNLYDHNKELEKAHKNHEVFGYIITDIKKNVITFKSKSRAGLFQWVRDGSYEKYAMERELRARSTPIEALYEDYNYENENNVNSKKSGPSPLFLEHVVADYYECVFEDDSKKFYLTFFQDNGRGAYQTSSGKVYLLSITHENDTRDKLFCRVKTLNEKKTNMEFDIDITFYPDITGKMISGGDVYDFEGTAQPYEWNN